MKRLYFRAAIFGLFLSLPNSRTQTRVYNRQRPTGSPLGVWMAEQLNVM